MMTRTVQSETWVAARWAATLIGDECETASGGTPTRNVSHYFGGDIPWVKSGELNDGHISTTEETLTQLGLDESAAKIFRAGTLLIALYGATVGRLGILRMAAATNQAVCAIFPNERVWTPFLFYYLLSQREHLIGQRTGGAQPNISQDVIRNLPLPLPPLLEQPRIAGVLEQADRLRRTRRYALELSDSFLPAAFRQFFGDPVSIGRMWLRQAFSDVAHANFRNGLSPSKSGSFTAKVLILSAITGGEFDREDFKTAPFAINPPKDKRVCKDDFLICRGNGNLSLVGVATFPNLDLANIVFPDTMIAARVDQRIVTRQFLQSVWKTQFVRRQIEAAARTTNGTYKINQENLSEIELPIPPLALQQQFASQVARHERLRAVQREALRQAEHLFQSLLHRAFSTGL